MNFQGLFVYTILIGIMELFAINLAKDTPYIKYSSGKLKEKSFFRWNIITPILIFSIIFGMRWNVGWDHIPYLYAYVYDDIERFEFGFKFITKLFQNLNIHYVLYFSLWAFLQLYFFLLCFKKEYYLFPYLIIFIFTQSQVAFWINGIRQALALCIILYSITYIDQKKPIYYIILSLIAILFHRSAIVIVIVLYPLLVNGRCYFKNKSIQYILLFLTIVGDHTIFSNASFIENMLDIYNQLIGYTSKDISEYNMEQLSISENNTIIGFVYIIRLIGVIIAIGFSSKMRLFYNSKWFNIMYNLFFIGVILNYLSPDNINIDRLFRYFYIFITIMMSYLCYYLYKNKKYRLLSISLIGLNIIGWIGGNIKNGWSYDFFFQHDISEIMLYLNN